jgi:broad specificity phosphatase PhoE
VLEILLTRHGLTERSAPEQYLGQKLDVPLSAAGRSAAERLRDRLREVPLERVISSPLTRATETARICRPDARIETDPRLAEADYGDWEGHTRPEITARWPELRAEWEEDPTATAPPNGESVEQVADRAASFLRSLVEWELAFEPAAAAATAASAGSARPDGTDLRRVLVVSHSTLNRVLLARCLGSPLRDYRRRFRQDWTNLTVLRFVGHEGAELTLCNDIAHLRGTTGVTWG